MRINERRYAWISVGNGQHLNLGSNYSKFELASDELARFYYIMRCYIVCPVLCSACIASDI